MMHWVMFIALAIWVILVSGFLAWIYIRPKEKSGDVTSFI